MPYLSTVTVKGHKYYRLVESYREDGKVKHRILKNYGRTAPLGVSATKDKVVDKSVSATVVRATKVPTKASVVRKEYLEVGDTSLIEDAARTLREKLLIRLLRRLECRVGEVLGLEERHIDFSRRQVRIEHEKERISLYCPYCKQEGENIRLSKKDKFCPNCSNPAEHAIAKKTNVRRLRKVPVDRDTLKLVRQYIKQGGITEVRGKRMLFSFTRQWAWHTVKACAERAGFAELRGGPHP